MRSQNQWLGPSSHTRGNPRFCRASTLSTESLRDAQRERCCRVARSTDGKKNKKRSPPALLVVMPDLIRHPVTLNAGAERRWIPDLCAVHVRNDVPRDRHAGLDPASSDFECDAERRWFQISLATAAPG
jgi:hypothetical protein